MKIRTFSDPVLRRPAAPIKRVNWATRRLAAQMAETMRAYRGVGLAAPQVGVSARIVVVDVGEGLHVLVNPSITAASGSVTDWEGCLSFPGLVAEVERAEKVTVAATGLDGKPKWLEGTGYFARALQHEIDHLDGVVFLDRAKTVEKIEPSETAEVAPTPGGDEEGQTPATACAERVDALRVAFMGTPDFALPTLEAVIAAGHTVVGVVTRPDRPAGRGRAIRQSPVKLTAQAFGLPVWQGEGLEPKVKLAGLLREWEADVALVVAYGVILPADALAGPRLGCINLHASLLPDYRGPAPIQRVIMDGRSVTGVTVMRMDAGVDTGDIIAQREVPIGANDDAGSLHDRLATAGAGLIVHALDLLATGRAAPRPQPTGRFRPAPRLVAADEAIDWRRPAAEIDRQVRALAPVPGAFTSFGGKRVKILAVKPESPDVADPAVPAPAAVAAGERLPGQVIGLDRGAPIVAAGAGVLVLRVLQPAGGARMVGPDFVNGYRVAVGDRFDTTA